MKISKFWLAADFGYAASGEIINGRVQLDTQANVNYVLAKHALPRVRRPWEATHCIGMHFVKMSDIPAGKWYFQSSRSQCKIAHL